LPGLAAIPINCLATMMGFAKGSTHPARCDKRLAHCGLVPIQSYREF
jgi:hypothetical protein